MNFWMILGIILAALGNRLVGLIWYSPYLFGSLWSFLSGVQFDKNEPNYQRNHIIRNILSVSFALLTAYGLAYLIMHLGVKTFMAGAVLGKSVWLFFVMPAKICSVLYDRKPVMLFLINTGYDLLRLAFMGSILTLFV